MKKLLLLIIFISATALADFPITHKDWYMYSQSDKTADKHQKAMGKLLSDVMLLKKKHKEPELQSLYRDLMLSEFWSYKWRTFDNKAQQQILDSYRKRKGLVVKIIENKTKDTLTVQKKEKDIFGNSWLN